jgi:chemotaxis protein methyltransferase CheR
LFAAVRDLIEERCGLRFDDSQRSSLSASVAARMHQLSLMREDEYLARLRGAAPSLVEAELRNLLNLVTVTETCFFRDASQFRLLREYIIPALMAERSAHGGPKKIRIWSAGCSSGEEAYSIAITLDEMGVFYDPAWSIEIIGTDLNTKALEKARRGLYSARAVRNVEGVQLHDHFVREGKYFALNDAIKKRVKFEFGNLNQTPMPSTGRQDIVFCKNVTIYFREEVTRKLVAGLHDTIAPDGFLLLGHAESLWQMSEDFTLVEYERAFCYRKTSHVAQQGGPDTVRLNPDTTYTPAAVAQGFSPVHDEPLPQYDACLSAFRSGEWEIAESALTSLIASCPTFVPARLLLGGLYVNRGRFDEATQQAEAVLKVNDLEPRAHLLLGMIAARQQRGDEALQSLRRALYLDDSLALAHFWLANVYRERGDVARASLEYENVVRDWECHSLQLTEEFASDLTAEQLVEYCRGQIPPHDQREHD